MKLLKKVKAWLPSKIAQEINEPVSQLNYLDKCTEDDDHEDMIATLTQDERCETIARCFFHEGFPWELAPSHDRHLGGITTRDNVFLTPHFEKHFDFTGDQIIRDYGILRCRMKFAANQLGFDILR